MRPGRSLGVILHAEQWQVFVAHALIGVVVQVEVGHLDVAGGERFRINAESVILCGDLDLAGQQILDWMIRAVMAEFQFESLAAEGQATKLVTEADSKDGNPAGQLANAFMRISDRLGIARAVRKENTVRTQRKNIFGGSIRRNDSHVAVMIDEQAKDVLLDTKIVGNDLKLLVIFGAGAGLTHLLGPWRSGQLNGTLLPLVRLLASYLTGKFLAGHHGQLLGFKDQLIGARAVSGNDSAERPDFANVKNKRACVDVPNNWNLMAIEIKLRRFRGAPTGSDLRELADDQRLDIGTRRFLVIEVRADVADVRIR
jgi:hypothetical protein